MKIFSFILFLAIGLGISSCQKDNLSKEAIITGLDFRRCGCCGGVFIEIGTEKFRFFTLPLNSAIDLNEIDFPMPVDVTWQKREVQCMGDEIEILTIDQ